MSSSPVTQASLLIRIRNPQDQMAWSEFVRIYAPLIHAYGRRRGLQDADAADLAQSVLCRLSSAATHFEYNPGRGQFRAWLFTITRNEYLKMFHRRALPSAGQGGTELRQLLEQQADDRADEDVWRRNYDWRLFEWAAQRVQTEFRESTWRAFWETTVENKEVQHVAQELGISVGAVYIARSRILARIRQEIDRVEGE